jgi:hypothetical protein
VHEQCNNLINVKAARGLWEELDLRYSACGGVVSSSAFSSLLVKSEIGAARNWPGKRARETIYKLCDNYYMFARKILVMTPGTVHVQ